MPNYPDLFYLMTKWPPLETNLYQLVHLPQEHNYLNFLCYNYSVCIFDTNETNLSSYSTLNLVVLIKKYNWLKDSFCTLFFVLRQRPRTSLQCFALYKRCSKAKCCRDVLGRCLRTKNKIEKPSFRLWQKDKIQCPS